jgi:predicted RND superfamily exporter protein
MYDSSGFKDGPLSNITQGAHQSVVYGTVGYRDGVRELYPQTLPNMIRSVADASFGKPQGGKTGKAVMSTFYFGGPLNTVDSSWSSLEGDALEQQNEDFDKWALNALNVLLMDAYNRKPHGLKVLWQVENVITGGRDPLYVAYIKSTIVPQDMRFLLAAFVFVFCFVAYQTQSLFLSSVALGMIVINILPTFALYVVVFRQTYLGVLQILSLFLIMGIGVDNVFVLLECYHQNRDSARPFAIDLSAAWHHAAKAMLCTSSTTCFSFLANATSSFPAVYTFGFWCCGLIIVNYCSVNTLYLAAVSVYDNHLAGKKLCSGHASCMKTILNSKRGTREVISSQDFL